jgi:hypothetical protein
VRYFITFACYGGHLHGDEAGSVSRHRNQPKGRLVDPDPRLLRAEQRNMDQAPYLLDHPSRAIVLTSLQEVCEHRGWMLLAAHVRTNHVHAVVEAEVQPERVMSDFKVYASRALNRVGRERQIESGGRGTGARGGCGKIETYSAL